MYFKGSEEAVLNKEWDFSLLKGIKRLFRSRVEKFKCRQLGK